MRIIKEKTLKDLCRLSKNKSATVSLNAWIYEVRYSTWNSMNELKAKYRNASIINSKRVVFNIKGNDYRLIVDIEYKLKIGNYLPGTLSSYKIMSFKSSA